MQCHKQSAVFQDSSSAGANVQRLNAESAASVSSIESSVVKQKKEVSEDDALVADLRFSSYWDSGQICSKNHLFCWDLQVLDTLLGYVLTVKLAT